MRIRFRRRHPSHKWLDWVYHSIHQLEFLENRKNLTSDVMYQSNRSFNTTPPPNPGHTPGIWRVFLPGREGIWSPPIGVGNLIASLDVMLRVALIPHGLIYHGGDKLWWIQKKILHMRGWLVENQRSTQDLFCVWRCLRPIYIYLKYVNILKLSLQ